MVKTVADPMNDYCPETWLGSDYIAPQPMTARDDLMEPVAWLLTNRVVADAVPHVTLETNALDSADVEAGWTAEPLYGPEAKARIEALEGEVNAVCCALGGDARFMDPPDGGDVSIPEQVRRCRAALDEAEAQRDEAVKALEPFALFAEIITSKDGEVHVPADDDIFPAGPIRWKHLRAAWEALASIKGKTNEQG